MADQLCVPIFVLTMLMGDTLMVVSFLVMMAIPIYEMWVLRQPLVAGKGQGGP